MIRGPIGNHVAPVIAGEICEAACSFPAAEAADWWEGFAEAWVSDVRYKPPAGSVSPYAGLALIVATVGTDAFFQWYDAKMAWENGGRQRAQAASQYVRNCATQEWDALQKWQDKERKEKEGREKCSRLGLPQGFCKLEHPENLYWDAADKTWRYRLDW